MPEAAPALVEILFLALVFFTIALAFSAKKITQALLGGIISALESVPVIGGKLAAPFHAVEQAVTSACGEIVSKCEGLVGASFHVLARFTDWLWRDLVAQATALLHVARVVGNGVYSLTGLRALVHRLEKAYHGIEHGIRTLTREYHGIDRRVRRLEHELAAGIGNDVRVEVAALRRTVHRLTTKTIPKIESEAQAAEADVTALGRYIADHYVSNAEADIEAAVAVGLAALGLGGLRCNSNPFKNNPNACGLWGDLSNLLAIAAIPLSIASLYELIGVAQNVTGTVVEGVEALLDV